MGRSHFCAAGGVREIRMRMLMWVINPSNRHFLGHTGRIVVSPGGPIADGLFSDCAYSLAFR